MDTPEAKAIGARIRELRERAGYTQELLAHQIDWEQYQVSRIESGRGGVPRLTTLVNLARALECRVSEIVGVLDE